MAKLLRKQVINIGIDLKIDLRLGVFENLCGILTKKIDNYTYHPIGMILCRVDKGTLPTFTCSTASINYMYFEFSDNTVIHERAASFSYTLTSTIEGVDDDYYYVKIYSASIYSNNYYI